MIAPLMVLGQSLRLPGPVIAITPDDYNTGDISRLTKPFTQVFTVSNNGGSLLSIAKIKYT
ncbi:MAG: hypothetical protein MUF69_12125 [Desulfobacterota bacterium]|nr:hypothetical protein [Thermodesulfobacteriota bacterium]